MQRFLNPLRRSCLFVIFLIGFGNIHAQIVQTHRYEQIQKSFDEFFSIIPLKEQGLALVREKNKYEDGKQKWDVILLDTALNEKANFTILIKERYPLIGYEYGPDHLYLLYRTGEHNKNGLELIDISIADGREVQRYEIKPELDFKITHFNRVGSTMVLGGYVTNEPAVLLYNMRDNQIKVVPGFFQKENELVELRVNQNGTFNVVIIDRSMKTERKLVFRTFDESGKLLLEDIVPLGEDKSLQTAISSSLVREELILVGTWGERSGKQSSGFFAVPVNPFTDQKVNYYSFGQLQHFTDYLNPKRAERIKENAREAADDNRIPAFSVNVTPFKLEEHAKGYFMLSEVYHTSNSMNNFGSPYGNSAYSPNFYNPFWAGYYPGMRMYRPYSYNNDPRNNDEIRTEETVLTAFNPDGSLKWDYSFKVDDIKKLSLEQVSDYYFDGSTVYFFYKKESELKYKVIDENEGLVKEGVEKVQLKEPGDELRSDRDYEDGIKHWFGNALYVWGYQTIRNSTHTDDRVRDVFFISKVVVE